MATNFSVTGLLVDVVGKEIYAAEVYVEATKIKKINRLKDTDVFSKNYIIPGFIDSHVHIESSMLVPSEFAKIAVIHGTVATVSDPHEIANVCGIEGVDFMIDNASTVNFKFNFGAPSCVPATIFETAGKSITSIEVEQLLQRKEIKYLSEMMNFPGVLNNDEEVMKKLAAAKAVDKPVDGHAPGLMGSVAEQYIRASTNTVAISTDHECFTADEALDKLKYGMKILIREGSAAKNFEALIPLLHDYPESIMFCSDDKHPDNLVESHINNLCARAVAKGVDVFKVLQAACINPVVHYKLDIGLLKENDTADFVLVKDLENFNVVETYINGELVAANSLSYINTTTATIINQFNCNPIIPKQLAIPIENYRITNGLMPVIEALEGQLITNKLMLQPFISNGCIESDINNDVLKIVVINRYQNAPTAKSFIKNFGLKNGAIASTVAHDSHNIVAIGVDDESLAAAINWVIKNKGGIAACSKQSNNSSITIKGIELPIAGLMSNKDGRFVANSYTAIDKFVKEILGSTLQSPFMTLSFMALLVIPHIKLSDKGLFNGDTFSFY